MTALLRKIGWFLVLTLAVGIITSVSCNWQAICEAALSMPLDWVIAFLIGATVAGIASAIPTKIKKANKTNTNTGNSNSNSSGNNTSSVSNGKSTSNSR